MLRQFRRQEIFLEEVLPIDCLECLVDGFKCPIRIFEMRVQSHFSEDIFAEPPDEPVPCIELDGCATYRADSHDWMIRCGTIAHQEEHAAPRHAFVGIAPGMTEVAPYVLKSQASDGAVRRRVNKLNIRLHQVGK